MVPVYSVTTESRKRNKIYFIAHIVCSLCTLWHVFLCFVQVHVGRWTAVTQLLRCSATNRKVAGSIPAGLSGFFVDIRSFRSHYSPGIDSTTNRNDYQDYFLGVRAAGA
jgi:hypothetical protein